MLAFVVTSALKNQVISPCSLVRIMVVVMVLPSLSYCPLQYLAPVDTAQGSMSRSRHGPARNRPPAPLDDGSGRARPARPAVVDHLRAGQAGAALAGLVLAAGGAEALRRTKTTGGCRSGEGQRGDDRRAASHRLLHHRERPEGAAALAGGVARTPGSRVRRPREGVLRRRRHARTT